MQLNITGVKHVLRHFPPMVLLTWYQKKTTASSSQPQPSGRRPPWCGSDVVMWLQSDAVPRALAGVDRGRPVDRMFPSVLRLQALCMALTLFVFPAESCRSLHHSPPPLAITAPQQECKHMKDTVTIYMHKQVCIQKCTLYDVHSTCTQVLKRETSFHEHEHLLIA